MRFFFFWPQGWELNGDGSRAEIIGFCHNLECQTFGYVCFGGFSPLLT